MKLLFKQRFFSWFDSYDIYDESGETRYVVKGQLSWGHRLKIFDSFGQEVGLVQERVLTLLPKFELYVGEQYAGCVSKEFTLFKPKFHVDFNGWRVEGDFLGWDYDVYNGCSSIIHISKELFHWGDTYTINFADPKDELEGLMLVIAIDAANCTQNNNG